MITITEGYGRRIEPLKRRPKIRTWIKQEQFTVYWEEGYWRIVGKGALKHFAIRTFTLAEMRDWIKSQNAKTKKKKE
jgi:hypothetical protein